MPCPHSAEESSCPQCAATRGSLADAQTWVRESGPALTLDAWLKEKARTWREVLDVFIQAGRGLEAAHAAGLVHRDFKPSNVLMGGDGRARVTDFGIARSVRREEHVDDRRARIETP